ncbi:MAG: NAD(P)/FAD-dependent oxidoreductase [bacterium]
MSARVVILGGGFGGAYCARALEKSFRPGAAEIFLIDRRNYFVFYPLLVEAGTGSLSPRHAVVSIRSFLRTAQFRMAEALDVDFAGRSLTCRAGATGEKAHVPFDHLVIALGSVTRMPAVPGLSEFGFEMKSLADAVALRDRAIEMLETADATADPAARRALLHFVVVGGNFTGVEVAGEFHVFLREAARRYRNVDPGECRVTLVEIAERILGALERSLADYATREMRRRGMDVRLKTSVARIEADRVLLDDGESLAAHTVIWCAGIAPNPLLARLGLPCDRLGYVLCDRELRVQGHSHVWAIGDCAVNIDAAGKPYPATAQHAIAQGKHVAANITRAVRGGSPRQFDYTSRGSTAAFGCRTGVASVFGVKISGFAAWFVWRTLYLAKMPGLGRKVRVAIDWALELIFPRDYVQLGVHTVGSKRTDAPIAPRNPGC